MRDTTHADWNAAGRDRPQADDAAVPTPLATILVVEDDDRLRRLVVRQMTGLGYRVLDAADGGAALALLERCPVDLLFTDIVMPGGVGGAELARAATARRPGLRVLFTTGFSVMTADGGGPSEGVMLLAKPYRREELAQALRRALDF